MECICIQVSFVFYNRAERNTPREVINYSPRVPLGLYNRKYMRPENELILISLCFPFWALPETLASKGIAKSEEGVEVRWVERATEASGRIVTPWATEQ